MDMISSIMSGKNDVFEKEEKSQAPILDFGDQEEVSNAEDDEEHLRNKAMANLRERRMRLK